MKDLTYNDRLPVDTQVEWEERIAATIFDHSHVTDAINEDTAAELGRMILKDVLTNFRPDLFE